jgi:hypothetical protein
MLSDHPSLVGFDVGRQIFHDGGTKRTSHSTKGTNWDDLGWVDHPPDYLCDGDDDDDDDDDDI